ASRMDALTETLNHGALVEHLAASVERAHEADSSLGVALVDIDNFRLLNDTHGHQAGDEVLLAVAAALRENLAGEMVMGRYGPDEFLVIAEPGAVEHLAETVEAVRVALADVGLQFASTERMPVTVSIG